MTHLYRQTDLINELTQVARQNKVHEIIQSNDRYLQEGATHYAKQLLKDYFNIDWQQGENKQ